MGSSLGTPIDRVSQTQSHEPPVLQPLYDVLKLLGKETLIPEAANKTIFVSAPVIGFASVLLLAILLWAVDFIPANGNGMFLGHWLVI